MVDRDKDQAVSGSRRRFSASGQQAERETKAPKIVLGEDLEYRVARLLIFMGYHVRRGCPIYTVGGLDQATDLDVMGIRYVEPFRRQMVIAECKSGDVGPLDRVFWLSGVKGFVEANEAFLVRKGTKWNIKDFAKSTGVQVLDAFRVSELEANYKIGDGDWPGVSDRKFAFSQAERWNKSLAGNRNWWELYITLRSEVRFQDPFPAINYLLQQLRLMTRFTKQSTPGSFERLIYAESVSQLAVFLMRVAEQAFDLSEADRTGFVEKGMTYGSLDPRFAERILNSAYNLTRQAVLHYTDKVQDIDKQLFRMPVPPGTEEVVAMVNLIVAYYPASLNFPQICDLLLHEVFVKDNRSGGWMKRIFPQSDLAVRIELVKSFLRFLVRGGASPSDVPEALFNGNSNSELHKHSNNPLGGETNKVEQATSSTQRPDASEEVTKSQPDVVDKKNSEPREAADRSFELRPPIVK